MINKILLILLFLCGNVFAAVENIDTFNDGTTPVVNENFRTLNDNVNKATTNVAALTAYFTNSILGTTYGGTSANLSACTKGSVPYFSSTGVMTCLAPATSGDTLQSGGVGNNIFFSTPISPALKLISVTSFSGASTTGNISIDNTKQYYVRCVLSANQNDTWFIRINADSGGSYRYVSRGWDTAANSVNTNQNTAAASSGIVLGVLDASNQPIEIDFYIPIQSTLSTKALLINGRVTTISLNSTGNPGYVDFMGQWATTTTATSFTLGSSGGGFTTSGTIYLYEIIKS